MQKILLVVVPKEEDLHAAAASESAVALFDVNHVRIDFYPRYVDNPAHGITGTVNGMHAMLFIYTTQEQPSFVEIT